MQVWMPRRNVQQKEEGVKSKEPIAVVQEREEKSILQVVTSINKVRKVNRERTWSIYFQLLAPKEDEEIEEGEFRMAAASMKQIIVSALNVEHAKISGSKDKGKNKMVEDEGLLTHIMNLIVWNVRGLNDPSKQREVRSLIKRKRAVLVCLIETRVKLGKSEMIKEY